MLDSILGSLSDDGGIICWVNCVDCLDVNVYRVLVRFCLLNWGFDSVLFNCVLLIKYMLFNCELVCCRLLDIRLSILFCIGCRCLFSCVNIDEF